MNHGLLRFIAPLLFTLLSVNAQAVEEVIYYHNDALGSPIAATDQEGRVVWRKSYAPYGQPIGPGAPNEPGYTGKFEEPDLGIQDFGARWYDPRIGRFLAIDPVGFDPQNPQSFNRYAYANNNPYRYVDPNGESPLDVGFFIVNTVSFGLAIYSGNPEAIASAGIDLAASAVGLASPIPGTGLAIKAARAADKVGDVAQLAKGNAVIGRMDDLTAAGALKPGEYTLGDRLPNLGNSKANYYQNMSVLREEMRKGVSIRDLSKPDTALAPTKLNPQRTIRQTFTGAERNQLRNKDWTFDGEYWNPPAR